MLDPDTLNKKYSFIGTYKKIVHEKKIKRAGRIEYDACRMEKVRVLIPLLMAVLVHCK